MELQSPTPLAVSNEPETFQSIRAFLHQIGRDMPTSEGSVLDFLVPEKLIAGGAGIRCRYDEKFGKGTADIIRPFAGAMFLLYTGQYDQPDLINQIAKKSNRDDGRYMIRMVLEGDVAMRFGDNTRTIGRGEALMYRFPRTADIDLLAQASQPHRYVHMVFTDEGLANAARLLHISVPSLFAQPGKLDEPETAPANNVDQPALEHFAESLWLYSGPDHLRAKLLQLKVGELFCLLGETAPAERPALGMSLPYRELRKLSDVTHLLDRSFPTTPSIEELSRAVGLNRRKLTEGFKALHGMSIGAYCRHKQANHARRLLTDSELTIAQISEQCGYQHTANFSRAFAKRFGISPAAFRKAL